MLRNLLHLWITWNENSCQLKCHNTVVYLHSGHFILQNTFWNIAVTCLRGNFTMIFNNISSVLPCTDLSSILCKFCKLQWLGLKVLIFFVVLASWSCVFNSKCLYGSWATHQLYIVDSVRLAGYIEKSFLPSHCCRELRQPVSHMHQQLHDINSFSWFQFRPEPPSLTNLQALAFMNTSLMHIRPIDTTLINNFTPFSCFILLQPILVHYNSTHFIFRWSSVARVLCSAFLVSSSSKPFIQT